MNVRLLARWDDDPLESPITLDAPLDATRRRIAGRWDLLGATSLGLPHCRPFVLNSDGRMDFGEGRADGDRFWRCDIREQDITVGSLFRVTWSGGESGVYRIDKIARPGSKAASESSYCRGVGGQPCAANPVHRYNCSCARQAPAYRRFAS